MTYTGKYRYTHSALLGEDIAILEYKSDDRIPYCDCSLCGKPITRRMWVAQSRESGIERLYLGSECVKKLS